MNIEVVGTGCPTCKQFYEQALKAAKNIGDQARVEYVADAAGMKRLMELGLMRSPALVVNGKVVIVGYEPSVDSITRQILESVK